MNYEQLCRLCLSTGDGHLNIFSVIGIEMKLNEIISEHFKCEVNERDPLPNYLCQLCWSITEAFHGLYQRSKTAQQRFLINPPIKVEPEVFVSELYQSHNEETTHLDTNPVKIEANEDDSILSENDPIDYDDNGCDDSDEEDVENNDIKLNKNVADGATFNRKCDTITSKKSRKIIRKNKSIEFEKVFLKNKHRFDLKCENCPKIFESLTEARTHYAKEHNNPRGYIKCCNAKLVFRSHIITHLNRHLDPEKFKCHECGKGFSTPSILNRHIQTHTENQDDKEVACDICKRVLKSKITLKKHLQWHAKLDEKSKTEATNEETTKFIIEQNFDMKCAIINCDTVFGSFRDAKCHYRSAHNDDGYIKCELCNIKMTQNNMFVDHIKFHLNPQCFKCSTCAKTFKTGYLLHRHEQVHEMKSGQICDYCGRTFNSKKSILLHMFSKHVHSEPTFKCEMCDKKFQTLALLKNHSYSVHREKKAIVCCEICGKSFYTHFHLNKHKLEFHRDKSERLAEATTCAVCGVKILTKSGIFYHRQLHTSGIHRCEHENCQREFPNRVSYLGHVRKYHREPKHKCSFCDKRFDIASKLKSHEESHTRHQTYTCSLCPSDNPKVFRVKDSLKTHMGRYHREERTRLSQMKKLQFIPTTAIKDSY